MRDRSARPRQVGDGRSGNCSDSLQFDLPGLRTDGPEGIGRGGVVEVFATAAEADQRALRLGTAYVTGNEAHHKAGRVLVRVNPRSPAAASVADAVRSLGAL